MRGRTASRSAALSYAALAALAVLWGYSWVVVKVATHDASVFAIALGRSALASVALLATLALTGRSLRPPPFGPTFVYGLLQTALLTLLQTAAVSLGGAGKSVVLTYTMPFWLLLLARVFLGERLRRAHLAAFAIAAVGLAVMVWPLASPSALPDLLAIAAGFVWAASAVWAIAVVSRGGYDLLSLAAWQMFWGTVALAAAGPFLPFHVSWTPAFVASMAFLSLGTAALGWALWLFVLARLGPATAGLGTLAVPALGLVFAALQLRETTTLRQRGGVALIFGALVVHAVAARAARGVALRGRHDRGDEGA